MLPCHACFYLLTKRLDLSSQMNPLNQGQKTPGLSTEMTWKLEVVGGFYDGILQFRGFEELPIQFLSLLEEPHTVFVYGIKDHDIGDYLQSGNIPYVESC